METSAVGTGVAPLSSDSNSQQLQDIQSYLATFNKEIGDGSTVVSLPTSDQLFAQGLQGVQSTDRSLTPQLLGTADGAQSFIQVSQDGARSLGPSTQTIRATDHETVIPQPQTTLKGTAMTIPPMVINNQASVQSQLIHALPNQDLTNTIGQHIDMSGQTVLDHQQPSSSGHTTKVTVGATEQESVVLNTGSSYQTVTIVPTSEVNQSGEVSYVLIVSQPDDEKNADLSVYDFKEEQGVAGIEEQGEHSASEVKKPAVVKFQPVIRARARPVTQLMCSYCNYTSAKRYLLTRHMKTHSEERPHKCNICDRGFKTVASLQNHINTHTGVKPHKCKECDATFTTSGELVRHVRYRHTYEKPHKCPDCDYASVELSKLKRHIRSHTGERPYQCPHCSYASPDTYKLKRHLRIHTGEKPYECDICHARFTQSNSLKAHRMIHTGEKPVFQCELCPTTCGRKTDLKIHVQKLHTSEHPVTCKKCGKSFPDRYTFKIHMKTHDGEKCFRCELCPYAAMTQRHLESHILTHTGEKPFKCDECDMSFRQKQLLRRHKNLYHTPNYQPPVPKEKHHQCVECGRTFAHRGNMLRHMALHDPDNPMYQEVNILKVEEEEAAQAAALAEQEEEDDEDEIHEDEIHDGESDNGTFAKTPHSHRQVQVQLVNEAGEHAGQIYLELENPDGTISQGEPISQTSYPPVMEHHDEEINEYSDPMEAASIAMGNQQFTPSTVIKVEQQLDTRNRDLGYVEVNQDLIKEGEHDDRTETHQL